jgi:hypothetical protein
MEELSPFTISLPLNLNNFRRKTGSRQMKAGHGNWKSNSSGAGASGVEVEHTPASLCRGTMGMAKNDNGNFRGDGIYIQLIQFMQNIQEERTMLDDIRQGNLLSPRTMVIIPTDRNYRSD